jgi:RNA polymerase sigma factor (sigma-70 family)
MQRIVAKMIQQSQKGDEGQTISLINKFKPILKKYSALLHTEDAFENLQLQFLILLHNIDLHKFEGKSDGAIVSYINRSIHHIYIKLSQAQQKHAKNISINDLLEADIRKLDRTLSAWDDTSSIMFKDMRSLLSSKEYNILYKYFFLDCSIASIAKDYDTSRQNINRIKERSIKKLREHGWDQ